MPLVRDQAICLRVLPYSETSQILSLLTREHGRIRVIAKGARRQTKAGKSKFDGGLDLLDSGDAVLSLSLERDLSILAEWSLRDGHRGLRTDLRTMYLGLFAAEFVERLLEEHDAHPRLFDQFERLLARLLEPDAREAVALAFCLNLLRQAGVLPDFGRCEGASSPETANRLGFSPRSSRLVCDDVLDATPDAIPLPAPALGAITSLLRLPRAGGALPALTRRQVDPAYRLLIAHIQVQTGARLRVARFIVDGAAAP
jgi:DNA repair protein RecO (recombination protein O)